jgi:hypothetical protein
LESRLETHAVLDSLEAQRAKVSVTRISYHGWPDCCLIDNGSVEAIVVPAIGRVMQFRLSGDADGAFWENRALDGQLHPTGSSEWINFGGDKCWPAPQSDWLRQQDRDWPPPFAFDGASVKADFCESGVALTSPVDPGFGIEVTRYVQLDAVRPVMRIRTEYHKILGSPVRVSVWSITQMCDPECISVLLHKDSKLPNGFVRQLETEPHGLHIEGGMLSLQRHPEQCTKIGADACSMAWIGRKLAVRIDAEAGPGEFPDGGCVTEIYTNPDPLPYVELETLGPLETMSAGDSIERATVYTIMPSSAFDPEAEARRVFQE